MKAAKFVTKVLFAAAILQLCIPLQGVRARSQSVKDVYFDTNTLKLVRTEDHVVQNLKDLRGGVYSLELSTTRSSCGSSGQEYLGFYNRTCSPSLSSRLTSGPVARGRSTSMMWREWMVRVVASTSSSSSSEPGKEAVTVSLQAFVHPDVENEAKCLGYVSSFYGNPEYSGTCAIPPYGDGLFLNATSNDAEISSQAWTVVESEPGVFQLVASDKPSSCLRHLGLQDCGSSAVLVDETPPFLEASDVYTTWKFIRRYDLQPLVSSPPPPGPVSPSPPAAAAPIPGPVISAPSSTSSGYANVQVDRSGGGSRCSVTSIVITTAANSIGAVPDTVELSVSGQSQAAIGVAVRLRTSGYNTIYAVGTCSTGETTERSNVLSVFYSAGGAPPPPPPSPSSSPSTPQPSPLPPSPPPPIAFVANYNNDSVSGCTISGSTLSSCTEAASGFNKPYGIAISGSTAFVTNSGITDTNNNTVSGCTISGSTLSCDPNDITSGFSLPVAIGISGSTAFVANYNSDTVSACTISDSKLTSCADSCASGLNKPNGIAISGSTAFVTNYNGNSVSGCTISGSTLSCNPSDATTGFQNPFGIAISGSTAFVVNTNGQSVSGCTISGSTLSSPCTDSKEFSTPIAIAISGSTAFVTDNNGTVSACTISGSTLSSCTEAASGFDYPYGIAIS